MVKIVYNGHMKSCRIKIGSSIINRWSKGEVKDISETLVDKLLKNNDFKRVGKVPTKKEKISKKVIEESKEIEEVTSFDLNDDNVFDKKDAQIAGQVLAEYKKHKNKDKKDGFEN